jgi:hypothetical protein
MDMEKAINFYIKGSNLIEGNDPRENEDLQMERWTEMIRNWTKCVSLPFQYEPCDSSINSYGWKMS